MRNFFLSAAMIAASSLAFAQTTIETINKRKMESYIEKGSGVFDINDDVEISSKVGINQTIGNEQFHLNGAAVVSGALTTFDHDGVTVDYNTTTNLGRIFANGDTAGDTPSLQLGTSINGSPANTAIVIDDLGEVGIGTTSPSDLLHVYKNVAGGSPGIMIENPNATGATEIEMHNDSGYMGSMVAGSASHATFPDEFGIYSGPGYGIDFWTNGTNKRMSIDSSGNVGIPAVLTSTKFGVKGDTDTSSQYAIRAENSSGNGVFSVLNNGESDFRDASGNVSMRIASNRNIGINTTTTTSYQFGIEASGQYVLGIRRTDGASSTSLGMVEFRDADNDIVGNIISDALNNTTTYGVSSDGRLKIDLGDWDALQIIKSVPARFYSRHKNPNGRAYGFFAQELHKKLPQAVVVGGEDPKTTPWMVDYGKATPVLWKAIQEQQVIIEMQRNWICNQANAPAALCN